MKILCTKFFSWIKDHFSLLFTVLFRLHVGRDEEITNPKLSDGNEDSVRKECQDDTKSN